MRILMITSCFAPKNVIGAVRTSKLAKYLVRNGHSLTVISPVLEVYDSRDSTLECEELREVERITIPYSSITAKLTGMHKASGSAASNKVGNETNTSIKARIYRLLRNGFSWWRDYEWAEKAKKEVRRQQGTFDLVISSYPYLAAHKAAAYAKSSGKAKKWIADFRDPLALESMKGRERKKRIKQQSKIVRLSDRTVYVTQTGAQNFSCYPEDRSKVVWIPNGFDADDFSALRDTQSSEILNDSLCFTYAGGMYHGERDCTPLFKAIRHLIDKGEITTDDIRFRYAGTDFKVVEEQALPYQLGAVLINEGRIPRPESLQMQYSSDCVVVATFCYRDGEGAMPGKIYEPLMMNKPILMLVSGSGHRCEAASFVNRLGVGCSYVEADDCGDVSQIETFIKHLIEDKNRKTQRFKSKESDLLPYRYDTIAKKMIEIIDEGDLK